MDIRYYPFDVQTCKLTYYAADETKKTIQYDHVVEVEMKEFTENSGWRVIEVRSNKVLRKNNYQIEVEFVLRRRPNFSTFTIIIPLLMLASINVSMFLIPIDSGEKGGFAITIFLAYLIFLTIIKNHLPDNSTQTSGFIVFVDTLLLMGVMSVIYSIVQAKLLVTNGIRGCIVQFYQKCTSSCMKQTPPQSPENINAPFSTEAEPVASTSGQNEESETNENKTTYEEVDTESKDSSLWFGVLNKFDVLICIVFFTLVLISSVIFFVVALL